MVEIRYECINSSISMGDSTTTQSYPQMYNDIIQIMYKIVQHNTTKSWRNACFVPKEHTCAFFPKYLPIVRRTEMQWLIYLYRNIRYQNYFVAPILMAMIRDDGKVCRDTWVWVQNFYSLEQFHQSVLNEINKIIFSVVRLYIWTTAMKS